MEEEKKDIDEYGPKRVFTLNHSDIPKGVTQCTDHKWRKLSENELECTKCPTAVIVNVDVIDSML